MTWNAVAWRLQPSRFQRPVASTARARTGRSTITDLAPYYEKIEREVGVCGNLDHLEDLPDGVFLPPVPMKCSDLIVQARRGEARRQGDSRAQGHAERRRPRRGRPATSAATAWPGCDVVAKYNSADVHMVPGAQDRQAGDLAELDRARSDGVGREPRHRRAVSRSRDAGRRRSARRGAWWSSCACVQSVALLLMSKSRLYPNGLGEFERRAGPQFHPALHRRRAVLSQRADRQARHQRRRLSRPRLRAVVHAHAQARLRAQFRRRSSTIRTAARWAGRDHAGVRQVVQAVRQGALSGVSDFFSLRRDAAQQADASSISITRSRRLRACPWRGAQYVLGRERQEDFRRHAALVGARFWRRRARRFCRVSDEPRTNHELGGCRMGTDPRTSVVNADCRSHDVPNLYVVDGSVFPSASEKNPTHTMMALAARAADHIAEAVAERRSM